MKYISIAEARKLPGLRLVLTPELMNPWSEAAKAVLSVRRLEYVAVARAGTMEANEDLVAWTGVRDAPVAVLDDQPAMTTWVQILLHAERVGSGPSLLPDDPLDRALVIGLSHEICGQDGFGWNRRLVMVERGASPPNVRVQQKLLDHWWATPATIARAPERLISILGGLAALLQRQEAAGSAYFVGDRLTACDIYWACFSMMIAPLPQTDCRMLDWNRANYSDVPPDITAALDPVLLRHRDLIFQRHIGLPLDL